MLPISTSRPPRHPIGSCRLHRSGHEGVPRGQEIPTIWNLPLTVFWVPRTLSCVIHVQVESGQIDFSHPRSLAHQSEASPPHDPDKTENRPRNEDMGVIGRVSVAEANLPERFGQQIAPLPVVLTPWVTRALGADLAHSATCALLLQIG